MNGNNNFPLICDENRPMSFLVKYCIPFCFFICYTFSVLLSFGFVLFCLVSLWKNALSHQNSKHCVCSLMYSLPFQFSKFYTLCVIIQTFRCSWGSLPNLPKYPVLYHSKPINNIIIIPIPSEDTKQVRFCISSWWSLYN